MLARLTKFSKSMAAALIFGSLAISTGIASDKSAGPPVRYDFVDAVDHLAEELARGAEVSRQTLLRLGDPVQTALAQAGGGKDFTYHGFSARTQIETLYALAEAAEEREGARFLAKLHQEVSKDSVNARLDPELQSLSRNFSTSDLERPLQFAHPRVLKEGALLVDLPPNVERAIGLLAEYTSPNRVGSVAQLMSRHLNFEQRSTLDRAIASSDSRRSAFRQIVAAHVPPPKTERALQNLLKEVAGMDKALGLEPRLTKAMSDLAADPLPPELARYANTESRLESRIMQRSASALGRTVVEPRSGAAIIDAALQLGAEAGAEMLEPPIAPSSDPKYRANRDRHAAYSARSLESRVIGTGQTVSSPSRGVSRSYTTAIRSSRAARGVAIGGPVHFPNVTPQGAYWIPSDQSPLFGRLAVTFFDSQGEARVASSRFLFADSFEAAVSTLWGNHGDEAQFIEGEILILMSMDPESDVGAKDRLALEQEFESSLRELQREYLRNAQDESARLQAVLKAAEARADYYEKDQSIPRGIVVHPALFGKELAWSASRVDFWFNDLDRVRAESEEVSGQTAPAEVRSGLSGDASTWQFYERESMVRVINAAADNQVLLNVRSRNIGSDEPYRSKNHFSISLFSFAEDRPSESAVRDQDGVWRLIDKERAAQPTLDWIFLNHHDFIRLNDYSESLSLLRWIAKSNVKLVVLDADGSEDPIATPDRINLGDVAPQSGSD
ncbi:MAG: hypothetical protein Rhims3KO_36080 [Hyphomicrobiales bacterium]